MLLFTKEKMAELKMKIAFWHQPDTVAQVVDTLQREQAVLSTTDTIIGLLAPLTHRGYSILDTLKRRDKKPYLILTNDFSRLSSFYEPIGNLHIEKLISQCWPGPLTIVFKAKKSAPNFVQGAGGTIAIRVPHHEGLLQVLSHFDGLFSTSANRAGEVVPEQLEYVDTSIIDHVGCIVGDQHAYQTSVASTILDCSQGNIRVVREGAYSIEALEKIAGVRFS